MKSLAEEFENRSGFKENLEKIILCELKKTEDIDRVTVREGKNGEYEVIVYTYALNWDEDSTKDMAHTIGNILGRKMYAGNTGLNYETGGRRRIAFYEKGRK